MARSNVREIRLPMTVVFAGSAGLSLILCSALALAGVDLGTNLSLVGLFLALLLPLGLEIRNRSSRPRRVCIIDYRTHHFGQGIASSIVKSLRNDRAEWETEILVPGDGDNAVQWQIRQLQSAIINSVDAVVILPAGDEDDLWHAMAAVSRSGCFMVAVDSKPPNSVFRRINVEPPRFVSAKYSATGTEIAGWLQPWLADDQQRSALLWVGPTGSWPGEERSRNVVYPLLVAGHAAQLHLMTLQDWAPDPARCAETLAWIRRQPGECAVYCADDENALALHLLCISQAPELRSRVTIIGCNAAADEWGNVPVLDMHAADVTIDIQVREQGKAVAQMLVRERRGKLSSGERSVFIKPKVVLGSETDGWLNRVMRRQQAAPSPADDVRGELAAPEAPGGDVLPVQVNQLTVHAADPG
jgi:DNA-binding LacI/PurR family transcriptional regulator